MRRVWLLGWLMMLAACRGQVPAEGAVRVSVSYGSYRPACLRVRAWDAQGHEGKTDITQGQFKNPAQQQVLVAVFREADWAQALNLEVTSFAAATGGACSGDPVEVRATAEPLQVLPKTFVPFEVALQAKDDDGDTFIAPADGVAGSDCDDGRPEVHPGAAEQCALNMDANCDGARGCQDVECQGQSCDDGDACTTGDLCQGAGVTAKCAGQLKQCVKSSACVTDSTCSQATGECVETRKSCTTPPATALCAQSTGVCIDSTGECAYPPKPANTSCDDKSICTTQDVCNSQGVCQGTPTAPCTARNSCVIESGTCQAAGDCSEKPDPAKVNTACTLSGSTEMGVCRTDGECSRFPYTPQNFNPDTITTASSLVSLTTTCPVTFDSTAMTWDHPECVASPRPTPTKIAATTSAPMVLFSLSGLSLGADLRLVGDSSVILAVYGNATLDNSLLAQGMAQSPGAGGNTGRGCPRRRGTNGSSSADAVSGGGGGAGDATAGAAGAQGSVATAGGGSEGAVSAAAIFEPLAGGCVGGDGGGPAGLAGPGGAGGGAVQLSVAGTLTVKKAVSASGGGGRGGHFSGDNGGVVGGGGGGGSGGQVLLEAYQLSLENSSAVTANGGAGGEGSGYLNPSNEKNGSDGADGAADTSAQATGNTNNSLAGGEGGSGGALGKLPGMGTAGSNVGLGAKGGGGGGGGAVGYIRLRSVRTCSIKPNAVLSPDTDHACPLSVQ